MASQISIQIRRRLMREIVGIIEDRGLKQQEAASLFHTTQPRISEVVRGKVDEFTIDSLLNMLAAAGVPAPLGEEAETNRIPATPPASDPVIDAYKKDVDRTLVREALRRTPTERVCALAELQTLAEEGARAGRRSRAATG